MTITLNRSSRIGDGITNIFDVRFSEELTEMFIAVWWIEKFGIVCLQIKGKHAV
jgi:hypothetical protein